MKTARNTIKETLENYLPLKPYFIEKRRHLTMGLIALFLVDLLQLLIPLVIKRAVDALTYGKATPLILLECGSMIIGLALFIGLFRYIWRYFLLGHSRFVEENLRNRLYSHLQSLSLSFYQRMKTGDLMARAVNDINAVRMAAGLGLVALVDGMVLGVLAIGFMLAISPSLTLVSLIPAPLVILFTRILTRRMSRGYERVQKSFADVTERVREAFAGIRIIKAYVREDWVDQKVEEAGGNYISENIRLARTIAVFFPMMAIFTNLGLAIVVGVGGRLTILGRITTGDFVAFISYLSLLAWPMMALGWVTNLLQRGAASMKRINTVLTEVPEITGPPTVKTVPEVKGHIAVRGLSLQYPGMETPALSDVTIEIKAGQTMALVGRVGSGKTTLLQTIPRLLKIPEAALTIDGMDVRQHPLKTLRQNIGFVTQEALIFSDTVRNNVIFGRRGISDAALRAALETAQILEETEALEQGLDTLLGEKGVTLSGGQRQRLTIARALLSAPPILILDDALSMVDTRTEERILNRILATRKDKTNLIVSHRVSTISRADIIVVLDRGKVVDMGNHEDLLRRGREYSELYEKQLLAQELEIGNDQRGRSDGVME